MTIAYYICVFLFSFILARVTSKIAFYVMDKKIEKEMLEKKNLGR